jgi:hypothetical protein
MPSAANEPFQNSLNTLNYVDLNNNNSSSLNNNGNSYFTAKPFKFIQNLKSMFTSSNNLGSGGGGGQYSNNQFNSMQSTFIDQSGQLDDNEPRSPSSPLLSPEPFFNPSYIEQQQQQQSIMHQQQQPNYQYQSYMTNAPVPPTFMMYKFDYNSQFLFDSFQNLIEKKGLILNNNNNNNDPSNTSSSAVVDVELNELDDLAKIKLEDIDELNCGSSPMNVAGGQRSTQGDSEQQKITTTTNAMFATPPANPCSRTNSLANAIFNFVGSQKKYNTNISNLNFSRHDISNLNHFLCQ